MCRLCRNIAPLRRSHYLPAAFYRLLSESPDRAPVCANLTTETALLTNRQTTTKLLCQDCEQLFSRSGEDHVAKICYRGPNKFLLKEQIACIEHQAMIADKKIFWGQEVEEMAAMSKLIYFALSMLWRGSVGEWEPPYNEYHGSLGRDEQDIHRYLVQQESLPDSICVIVFVDLDSPSLMGLTPPSCKRVNLVKHGVYAHSFMIPGLQFMVFIGKHARLLKKRFMVFEWDFKESGLGKDIAKAIQSCDPKGKLKKQVDLQSISKI